MLLTNYYTKYINETLKIKVHQESISFDLTARKRKRTENRDNRWKNSARLKKEEAIKEAIGRVYETICCSLVSQRCVCSSISRGTIRKLGGGKIKGNVETNLPSRLHRSTCLVYHFPRPRTRRPYLFLVSSSLWISILVDGDDVTSTDEIFTPFWERNLSFFGFETRKM